MDTNTRIPFTLDPTALMERLHIRTGSNDALEFGELLSIAERTGKPKFMVTETYVQFVNADTVDLAGFQFTSTMLRQNLSNVERVFPFVVTCGQEMDQVRLETGNFLAQYWWDAIKESLLTSAFEYLQNFLNRRYLLNKISTMSPGSGDIDVWPIEQQRELFNLLGDVNAQIGVELTDSYLMIPNKTISGIVFPTEKDFRTCQVCHRENCPSRSAVFDQALWESIQ